MRSVSIMNLTLAHVNQSNKTRKTTANEPYYYVYNIDDDGFIIVSGNDEANDILAYSYNGTFDAGNLPDGFKYSLDFYQEELEYLYELEKTGKLVTNNITDDSDLPSSISPLVQAKWNQDDPYNLYCPIVPDESNERAVSGCVATAAAQVMHYHQWPAKGNSSKTYTTRSHRINLTVDYSETYYDWGNMTNTYGSSNTQQQKEAVVTLMYHIGTAVNMDYGHTSGAYSFDMVQALVTYFNYDKNIQYINRNYYSHSD